jgi:hypothetical protein
MLLLLLLLACVVVVVLPFDILLADVATPTLDYRFCFLFSHDTLDALIMILSL